MDMEAFVTFLYCFYKCFGFFGGNGNDFLLLYWAFTLVNSSESNKTQILMTKDVYQQTSQG